MTAETERSLGLSEAHSWSHGFRLTCVRKNYRLQTLYVRHCCPSSGFISSLSAKETAQERDRCCSEWFYGISCVRCCHIKMSNCARVWGSPQITAHLCESEPMCVFMWMRLSACVVLCVFVSFYGSGWVNRVKYNLWLFWIEIFEELLGSVRKRKPSQSLTHTLLYCLDACCIIN